MKKTLLLISILLLVSSLTSAATKLDGIQSAETKIIARKVVDNLLSREYMLYRDGGLHYAEACTAVGALRFAEKVGDKQLADKIIARYEKFHEPDSILISRELH